MHRSVMGFSWVRALGTVGFRTGSVRKVTADSRPACHNPTTTPATARPSPAESARARAERDCCVVPLLFLLNERYNRHTFAQAADRRRSLARNAAARFRLVACPARRKTPRAAGGVAVGGERDPERGNPPSLAPPPFFSALILFPPDRLVAGGRVLARGLARGLVDTDRRRA
jgi:hypothetical protein